MEDKITAGSSNAPKILGTTLLTKNIMSNVLEKFKKVKPFF